MRSRAFEFHGIWSNRLTTKNGIVYLAEDDAKPTEDDVRALTDQGLKVLDPFGWQYIACEVTRDTMVDTLIDYKQDPRR